MGQLILLTVGILATVGHSYSQYVSSTVYPRLKNPDRPGTSQTSFQDRSVTDNAPLLSVLKVAPNFSNRNEASAPVDSNANIPPGYSGNRYNQGPTGGGFSQGRDGARFNKGYIGSSYGQGRNGNGYQGNGGNGYRGEGYNQGNIESGYRQLYDEYGLNQENYGERYPAYTAKTYNPKSVDVYRDGNSRVTTINDDRITILSPPRNKVVIHKADPTGRKITTFKNTPVDYPGNGKPRTDVGRPNVSPDFEVDYSRVNNADRSPGRTPNYPALTTNNGIPANPGNYYQQTGASGQNPAYSGIITTPRYIQPYPTNNAPTGQHRGQSGQNIAPTGQDYGQNGQNTGRAEQDYGQSVQNTAPTGQNEPNYGQSGPNRAPRGQNYDQNGQKIDHLVQHYEKTNTPSNSGINPDTGYPYRTSETRRPRPVESLNTPDLNKPQNAPNPESSYRHHGTSSPYKPVSPLLKADIKYISEA